MDKRLSGLGIGFRPEHYAWVTENRPKIDWFEIITENFLTTGGRPRRFLELLRSQYPIATHGVSLSIASGDPLDFVYLRKLKELVGWLEPKIVSDHLCWTHYNGINSHDLLPVPYTRESLLNVATKVNQVQDYLNREIILENPSIYLAFAGAEMSEPEFFRELCRSTGCGILLDINNVFVNWKNLGWNPSEYFEALPSDSIKQFHLAGHSVQAGMLIDTHDEPVPEGVWSLFRKAARKWPNIPTLVEWDDKIPEFERLMAEADKARAIQQEVFAIPTQLALSFGAPPKGLQRLSADSSVSESLDDLQSVQTAMITMISTPQEITDKTPGLSVFLPKLPVSPKKGARVYRDAYFLRVRSVLEDLYPTLAFVTEEEGFCSLVAGYLAKFPPYKDSVKYAGERLHNYLRTEELSWDFGVPNEALADIALLEWTRAEIYDGPNTLPTIPLFAISDLSPEMWEQIHFKFSDGLRVIHLQWDIGPVWQSVHEEKVPERPLNDPAHYIVCRPKESVFHRKLAKQEFILMEEMLNGRSFLQACSTLASVEKIEEIERVVPLAVQFLREWLTEHLISRMYFEAFR